MQERPDFLDNVPQSEDSLDVLKEKVDFYLKLQTTIKAQEEATKELKKKFNQLGREEIPNIVLSRGLSRLKLTTGETVSVDPAISVKIKDEPWFHKFLEQREEDEIIKTVVSLDRMPSVMLVRLYEFLDKNEYPYDAKKGVHPKTREKYFKELLGMNLDDSLRAEYITQGRCIAKESLPGFCDIFLYHKTKIK